MPGDASGPHPTPRAWAYPSPLLPLHCLGGGWQPSQSEVATGVPENSPIQLRRLPLVSPLLHPLTSAQTRAACAPPLGSRLQLGCGHLTTTSWRLPLSGRTLARRTQVPSGPGGEGRAVLARGGGRDYASSRLPAPPPPPPPSRLGPRGLGAASAPASASAFFLGTSQ